MTARAGLAPSAATFFTHYLATLVLGATLVSFGTAVSATMPTFDTAQACVGLLAPILFLFGGMFSKPSSMPPGAKWIYHIDPIGYAFRALIPLHFECDQKVSACPTISVPDPSSPTGLSIVDRKTFVYENYELSYADVWPCIGYCSIFILVFQILNIYATYTFRHISR